MSKKEAKEEQIPQMNDASEKFAEIRKLINSGIPVREARFHAAVNNGDGVPEMQFNDNSTQPGRRVQMWSSYSYLVCCHSDVKKGDRYILVPLSNVIFAHAK